MLLNEMTYLNYVYNVTSLLHLFSDKRNHFILAYLQRCHQCHSVILPNRRLSEITISLP